MGYKLTQTSLKDMEKESTCPLRWKTNWIDLIKVDILNDSMIRGLYFESLIISKNAKEEEDWINSYRDTFYTKFDKKRASTIRIEDQAELAKSMLFDKSSDNYLGWEVKDCQIKYSNANEEGTWDILAENDAGDVADIDIKLTGNLESTYSEYSWGNYDSRDFVQQVHYHNLHKEKYGVDPKTFLLVFDYSVRKNCMFLELDIHKDAFERLKERKFSFWSTVNKYHKNGWTEIPSESECKNCPLNKICKKSWVEKEIEQER